MSHYQDELQKRFIRVQHSDHPEEVLIIDSAKAQYWEAFNWFCGGAFGLHAREALFLLKETGQFVVVWEPRKEEESPYGHALLFNRLSDAEALDWLLRADYGPPKRLRKLARDLSRKRKRVPVMTGGPNAWFDPADGRFLGQVTIHIRGYGLGDEDVDADLYRLPNGKYVACHLRKGEPCIAEVLSEAKATELLMKHGHDLPAELATMAESWNIARGPSVVVAEPNTSCATEGTSIADNNIKPQRPDVTFASSTQGELPIRGSRNEDLTAFLPAKDFLDPLKFSDYKAIRKFLRAHSKIRNYNPTSRRLMIHAGDWQRALSEESQMTSDSLDLPAVIVDAVLEKDRRLTETRQCKFGKQ